MNNFYPGCLCCIKVLSNDEDTIIKVFAEDDNIFQPIIDYITRLYDRHEEVTVADVLFGAWATRYGSEIEAYTKYILHQNPNDQIVIRHHTDNEKYAQYVLTISGFKKES